MVLTIRFYMLPLILLVWASSGRGQELQPIVDWETLSPESEEFTVSMPKNSKAEQSKEPYLKREINTHLYLWTHQGGPVFAVVSLSGIKSDPALYSELARVNSYVDAFKKWFPSKVRGKTAVAKLTLVGEKYLRGHPGREYRMTIEDLSGTAQVYATRKRFYAVVSLNSKSDAALQDRFLSSFVLPEKVVEPAPGAASVNSPKQEEGSATEDKAENKPPAGAASQASGAAASVAAEGAQVKPSDTVAPHGPAGAKTPISGGVLNSKATSLPRPEYPPEARAAKASGVVTVQVTVDEYGNVIAAHAISGHPLLQQPSVDAALQAKFSPTFLMGEPVKVTGVITYNFAP